MVLPNRGPKNSTSRFVYRNGLGQMFDANWKCECVGFDFLVRPFDSKWKKFCLRFLPSESAAPKSASCGVTAVPLDELWSRRRLEQLWKLAYYIGNLPDNRCLKRGLADRTTEKNWKTYKYMGFAKTNVLADGNVWELNSNANRYVDDTYEFRNLSLGFRCQSRCCSLPARIKFHSPRPLWPAHNSTSTADIVKTRNVA